MLVHHKEIVFFIFLTILLQQTVKGTLVHAQKNSIAVSSCELWPTIGSNSYFEVNKSTKFTNK